MSECVSIGSGLEVATKGHDTWQSRNEEGPLDRECPEDRNSSHAPSEPQPGAGPGTLETNTCYSFNVRWAANSSKL